MSGNRYTPPSGEDLKRQYRAKLARIRELEDERAALLERGGTVPRRLQFHLEMTRVEAEELRMWGHREFVRTIREAG
jgi:hypothetical protein